MRYARPSTRDEATQILGEGGWQILAGGTDFYPSHVGQPMPAKVLDLGGIDDLRGITRQRDGGISIGARTTWSEITKADLPQAFDGLKLAAREVGSVQIQNTGTIAGNLCNASPAADGVPPLLVLDAEVELYSASGTRYMPIAGFIAGNRRTARRDTEFMTAVRIPPAATAGTSAFLKLGARKYLVISIAMAAARLELDDAGRIASARVAVGSCSEVAQRLTELESELVGRQSGEELAGVVTPRHVTGLAPISDVRGTADYRRSAAAEIVRRTLRMALPGAKGTQPAGPGRSQGQAA